VTGDGRRSKLGRQHLRRSSCRVAKKADKSAKFRVWDKVPEESKPTLICEEFSYNTM